MSLNIQITDTQVQLMLDFINGRRNDIMSIIKSKQNELDEIEALEKQMMNATNRQSNDQLIGANKELVFNDGYSPNFTWNKKIRFVLAKKGALTTREVVNTILDEYEPNLKDERKRIVATVSAILSAQSGDGKKFVKSTNEADEYIFSNRVRTLNDFATFLETSDALKVSEDDRRE